MLSRWLSLNILHWVIKHWGWQGVFGCCLVRGPALAGEEGHTAPGCGFSIISAMLSLSYWLREGWKMLWYMILISTALQANEAEGTHGLTPMAAQHSLSSHPTFSPLLQRSPGDTRCQGCELTPLYLPETSLPPSKRVKNKGGAEAAPSRKDVMCKANNFS